MKPITYTALPTNLPKEVKDKLKTAAIVCRSYKDDLNEIRPEFASHYDSAFRNLEKIEEAARLIYGLQVTREPFPIKARLL